LNVLAALKNSAGRLHINFSIRAESGQLDDYEQAKEILSQYGFSYRDEQD